MSVRHFKGFTLFGILLASVLAYPASYGQSDVVLSLDRSVYAVGESFVIHGLVQSPSNVTAILQVWNPNNEACSFQQVNVNSDGSFTADPILLSGRLCSVAGTYTIKAFYGEFEGSTTFEVQQAASSTNGGHGKIQAILDILNKAKQNIDNKIADDQSKGLAIPDDISTTYKNGLAELESAKQAAKADNPDSAEHAKNALKAFKTVFAQLTMLEQGETKASTSVSQGNQQDLEKAEEISKLKQAIAQAMEFKNRLVKIAATGSNGTIEAAFTDFDKVITEASDFADKGDLDSATKSLANAKENLLDIYKSLIQNTQKQKLDKAKEFVAKTIERIDSMIADAKALGISQEVIDALEATKQKLLNANTLDEIQEIVNELKSTEAVLSEQKGKNFEKVLEYVQSQLKESKSDAQQKGLDLKIYERIQGMIDDAVAKQQSNETRDAIDTLQSSAEMLREVTAMLDKIGVEMQDLNTLEKNAQQLKVEYQNDTIASAAIDKALRLINGARQTLDNVMSGKDFETVKNMAHEAELILERVGNEAGKKSGANVSAIEKQIKALESTAAELKAKAGDNQNAIDEVNAALNDIEDAKKSVNNGQFDDVKQKINDAKEHLRKARDAIEHGKSHGEGKKKKGKEEEG